MFKLRDCGPRRLRSWARNMWVAGIFLVLLSGVRAWAQPVNDNFTNAIALPGNFGTNFGSNINATSEPGEPVHTGSGGGKSVWFKWTATFTGTITFSTAGSSFDTVMAIYTGTNVSGLSLAAQSDDVNFPVDLSSLASLAVIQGTNYYIAVDGFLGDSGSITLTWRPSGTFSAGDFFIAAPSVPLAPTPGQPFVPPSAPLYSFSQNDSGVARARVVRAAGSAGRVSVGYLITNTFYTNLLFTNVYATNTFITNFNSNMVAQSFTNILATNYFTSNNLQNFTNGIFFYCQRISGLQLPAGPLVTITNSSDGPGAPFTNLVVTNSLVPCNASATTNTVTNGNIITVTITRVSCTNFTAIEIVPSCTNGVEYTSTNSSLVFDDFEMAKDIPIVFGPLPEVPFAINRVVIVRLTNAALDALESTSLAPPTVNATASNTFITIMRATSPLADPCNTPASVVNMENSRYLTTSAAQTIQVRVTRSGTNFSGTCSVNYSVGNNGNGNNGGNTFPLQPGSDYAYPQNGNPNSSHPPDFVAATGTITWAANDAAPKIITIDLLPNNTPFFNRDIQVVLSNPTGCVLGEVPNASVTIQAAANAQPAGAGDRNHNRDNDPNTVPPFNQFPGANNVVYSVVVQPDGRALISGDFTAFNTIPRNHIARMNVNGQLDTGFMSGQNTGANDTITSMTLQPDDKIIIGGIFTSYNGTNRHSVARLNSDGTLDPSFNPGIGVDGIVWSTALQSDGKVLIAGSFATVNGTNRNSVARLNSNGSLDTTFDPGIGPNDTINAVAVQGDGKVLIGGDFTTLNNQNISYLSRLNADGSVDTNFNLGAGLDGSVFSIVLQNDGKVLAGGSFGLINLISRHGIARLNTDGSLDAEFNPGSGVSDTVYTISLRDDGRIYIGGLFSSYNSTRRVALARLFANGVLDTSFLDTAYNQFAGLSKHYFNPVAEPAHYLFAIAQANNGNLVVGGGFSQLGGGGAGRTSRLSRLNVAQIVGGETPGPGNIGLSFDNYNADKFSGSAFITIARSNGFLGPASATFTPVPLPAGPGAAIPGQDFVFTVSNPVWPPLWSISRWDFTDFTNGLNTAAGGPSLTIGILNNTNSTGNLELNMSMTQPQTTDILFLGGENMPIGVALDSRTSATLTIVDNTVTHGALGFSTATFSVNENATNAQITVTRTNGTSGLVTVQYSTVSGGTAVPGPTNDYIVTSGTLTFNTGQTNKSFNVPIVNNSLVQPDRTVNLSLLNATGGAVLGQSNAVLTIIDDDFAAGRVNFTSTNLTVHETDGAATFSVTRTGGSVGALSVTYVSSDGTATNGQDYGAVSNVLTWNSGDVSAKTFTIPLIHNQLVTSNKFLTVRLTNAVVAGVTNNTALGTRTNATLNIINDDFFGSPTLSSAFYSVNENSGFVTITVNRLGGSSQTLTVNYATSNGTALTPTHYAATSGTLTFNPGEFSKSFTVAISNDFIQNGNRFFSVALSSPTPAGVTLGTPSTATITIFDDELVVQPPGSVDTTLDASTGFNDTVYALALQNDGRILAGGDFTVANGTPRNRLARLNVNGSLDPKFSSTTGGTDGSVRTMAIQSDGRILVGGLFTTINGANRHYFGRLNLDGGLDETFDPGAGADNPVYAVAETFVGPVTNAANRRVLIGGSFVSVDGTPRNNIARVNNDGSLDSGFSPVGANGTVYALAVYSTNDPVNGGKILIGGDFTSVNGVGRSHIARLNVDGSLDTAFNPGAGPNDSVRAIAIQVDGKALIGGLFTSVGPSGLNRIARLNPNGTVDPLFTPGAGADSVVSCIAIQQDHKILLGGGFTRANGVTRNRLTRLNEDGTVDPGINFGLGADNFVSAVIVQPDDKMLIAGGFTQFDGASTPRIARLFGRNDIGVGAIEFTSPAYQVIENVTNIVIGVRRNGGTAGSVSATFNTSDGTALAGTNYGAVSNTVVFQTGETFQTVNVPIISNNIVEIDRTVNLTLSNPSGGAVLGGLTTAVITILNDDSGVNLSSPTYTVIKNVINGAAVITIQRQGSSIGPASVEFFTGINGTATAGIDYTPVSNTVFFADGETSQTISVPVINNGLVEGNRTVELLLANPTNTVLLAPFSGLLTIIDNNLSAGSLAFSTSAYSVAETGVNATINVFRTAGSVGQISVNFTASGGNAVAGLDYAATNGSLTFFDGETNKSFTVHVLHNPAVQGDRTVNLTLSNPTGGAQLLAPNPVPLTITDVDIGLAFDQPAYFVNETNGTVVIGVRRLSGTNGPVSVQFSTTNGTAVAGTDYTSTSGTLNFASGETFKTFNIQILRNPLITGSLIFQVNLSNPSGNGQLVSPTTTAVTILDDDSGIAFMTNAITVSETLGIATIQVQRTGNALGAVSVNFATSDGTAAAGTRYFATNGVLNFADGQVLNSFNVNLINDNLVQGDQTVNLSLLNPTNGAQLLAPSNAVLTITDDDAGFSFSSASYSVSEGGVFSTITVQRSGFTNSSVSVNFATSDGSAHAGTKYLATNGLLSFAPGEVSKTFNVGIIDNSTIEGNQTVNLTLSGPSVSSSLLNPNAAVLTIVDNDGSLILPAGTQLISETGAGPANGGIDPGETVTLWLALRNALGQNTTNLVATLLTTNGVTNVSGSQNYGVLVTNGPSVSRQFQFTATGTNGAQITAVLQLQDGTSNLGTATFSFTLGSVTNSFTNSVPITINDNAAASPYPATINVSALAGVVKKVTATVSNLNHGDLSDVSILLRGPTGTNTLLMAKIGGAHFVQNVTLTFDDAGPALTANAPTTGTYRPTQFSTNIPFPASTNGPGFLPQPFGTQLAAFTNTNPNGTWSLYVFDDTGLDAGIISNGWSLNFSTLSSVTPTIDLVVFASGPTNAVQGSNITYTISITNAGPASATGILLTNVLPPGVTLVTNTASQGSWSNNAGTLICNLGQLVKDGTATATIVVNPGVAGLLTNTISGGANVNEANPANNSTTIITSVNTPTADLAVGIVSAPNPLFIGSNVNYTVTVTNLGPATAANVILTNTLPAGINYVTNSPGGIATNFGGTVIANLGTLGSGSTGVIIITAKPAAVGTFTNTASAGSSVTDPLKGNNKASVKTVVDFVPLSVSVSGTNLTFTWPSSATGYVLETTPSLTPVNWTPVSPPPTSTNGQFTVTIGTTNSAGFFRLRTVLP